MEVIKKTILQAVTTGMTQGNWNAKTNVPNIEIIGKNGNMWYVSNSGNTELGDINKWYVGDWAIKFNNIWGKIINKIPPSSGNTLIIQNLDAVYHMKIGLKQEIQDIGFFDTYIDEEYPYSYIYDSYGGIGYQLLD